MRKNHSKILIKFLLSTTLLSGVAFSLFTKQQNQVVQASAWSGTQTSTAGSYYNAISESATGTTLSSSLNTLVNSGSVSVSYDWSRYEAADEAEGYSSMVLQIYARTNIAKTAHVSGSLGWNREHTYPQSKLNNSTAEADNHLIFADDNKTNSIRGNKSFAEVSEISANQVVDSTGRITENYSNSTYFEPLDAAKGEVARATFYTNVKYGHAVTGNFDTLETALRWHIEHPVTNREIYRNNTVHTLQKNRNPFIDKPEYACRIWGATNSATQQLCSASQPVAPTSITVSPSSSSVNIGNTVTLHATANSGASNSVNWSSGNTQIATVNSSGEVTPVAVGQVTITATSTLDANVYGTSVITVTNNPIAVSSIALSPTSLSLVVNQTSTITPIFSPSNATNKIIAWTSSQPAIASVSASGVVTALSEGTTTITATTQDGGKTATTSVTVSTATSGLVPVTDYTQITAGQYFITANYNGTTYYLPTANGEISSGSSSLVSYSDINQLPSSSLWTFTYNSTNNWRISYANNSTNYFLNSSATNDGIGASNASTDDWTASAGSSSIYLKSSLGTRFLTTYLAGNEWRGYGTANTNGTSNIILYRYQETTNIPVTSVELNKTNENVYVGDTSQLVATVLPSNATNKNVVFESEDDNVITVSSTGLVTAVGSGTASVSAITEDGSFIGTCIYHVSANLIEDLSIYTPATKTTFTLGEPFSTSGLTLLAAYSNGTESIINDYQSSAVNTNLLGQQTVTLTYEGLTASYLIQVTNLNASVSSSAQYASDLIISEYIEGSGNNKAIEIYNGTGETVDLSHYDLKTYSNGDSSPKYTYAFSGTINHGATVIVKNGSAESSVIQNSTTLISDITFYNGNDAVTLYKDTVLIDILGVIGVDPGIAWTSGDKSMANQTLVRKANIMSPSATFDFAQWDNYTTDTVTYLGTHTMEGTTSIGDVTFSEQAIAYATYFLDITDEYCTVLNGSSVPWENLSSEYGFMANDSKDFFIDNSDSPTISAAKARYYYLIHKYTNLRDDNFLVSSGGNPLYTFASPEGNNVSEQENTLGSILLITIFSITSLAGYYFISKKKRS